MNKILTTSALVLVSFLAFGEGLTPTVFDHMHLASQADKVISFNPTGTGEYLPVVWGLDTAWLSESNTVRGMRHMTPEIVDVVRVSYTPTGLVDEQGNLPEHVREVLDRRLAECDRLTQARGGRKVAVALNLDGGEVRLRGDYFYVYEGYDKYWGDDATNRWDYYIDYKLGTRNHEQWARLIATTAKYIQNRGYEVVSIAPFNEPDEVANGLTINHFKNINKILRANYPELANVRLSGGNTLNTDSAYKWYDFLKEDLQEGNTHELAGTFDHYADFFKTVREDGNWATADELHNTMEAMVGVEYGMQEGIWWGTAERTRGEFCQASNTGTRLAYAENRGAWNSAAVYESRGKVQVFVGASERQARESSYSFVSDRPVFYDGVGPTYSYKVNMAGDPKGAYGTSEQRTAESVFDVEWGEDVRPDINGKYIIVNQSSGKAVTFDTSKTSTNLVLGAYNPSDEAQQWNVGKVAYNMGGDFAYYYINAASNNGMSWNLFNFALSTDYNEAETAGLGYIFCYPNGMFNNPTQTKGVYDINMEWWLEYDGDGWFHIISKTSGYCVKNLQGNAADGTVMIQAPYSKDDATQKFRFVPAETAPTSFSTQKVATPAGLTHRFKALR